MAKFVYPDESDFRSFVGIIKASNFRIKKYLPPIDDKWYEVISECVQYVHTTEHYEDLSFIEVCARILYKVAKRHELGDGNKRSSVMAVYVFCLLNDYYINDPQTVKKQAKRVAATKGRLNEATMRKRIALVLGTVIGNLE